MESASMVIAICGIFISVATLITTIIILIVKVKDKNIEKLRDNVYSTISKQGTDITSIKESLAAINQKLQDLPCVQADCAVKRK